MVDLVKSKRDALRYLDAEGFDTPKNIADGIGVKSTKTLIHNLRDMEERGLLRRKARGVYLITDAGRERAAELDE